jgi:hypothetical protein
MHRSTAVSAGVPGVPADSSVTHQPVSLGMEFGVRVRRRC